MTGNATAKASPGATNTAPAGGDSPDSSTRSVDGPTAPMRTYACGGCDNRWPGVSRAHCSACHRTFAGFGLFDRHRRLRGEEGTCLDPEAIVATNKITKAEERVMFLVNGIWSAVEERAPSIGQRRTRMHVAKGIGSGR